MTDQPEKLPSQAPEDLTIRHDELEEVVSVAARLQIEGKKDEDAFQGDAIDSIVETTGVSREALAQAQQLIKTRNERKKWISRGVAAAVVLGGLGSIPLWWERAFPPPPQNHALQVEELMARARLALDKDDPATALGLAASATKKDPENFRAWNLLGQAYAEQRRLVEASRAYQKGIAIAGIRPDAVELHCNYGTLLTKSPATRQEAVAAFEKALACNPHHARTHNNLAWAYELMYRRPEAFRYYKRATELEPDNAQYRKNYDEAVRTWTPIEKGEKP